MGYIDVLCHLQNRLLESRLGLSPGDVWTRPAVKSNRSTYYDYVLLYTDDALVISENAEQILRTEIGKFFQLKEESIGPPRVYLGGRVHKVTLENRVTA